MDPGSFWLGLAAGVIVGVFVVLVCWVVANERSFDRNREGEP